MIADIKLIELGRQFEGAKAEARPLKKESRRLFDEYERLAEAAGLSDELHDRKAHEAIMKRCGYRAVRNAFTAKHSEAMRLMRAIHRAKATTLAGFAVKAAAVAFDNFDFEVNDPVPTDVAERELYRLARDMAKVVKMTACGDLSDLIDAYRQAQAAWRKLDDETVGVTDNSPEWRAYQDAENAVLSFPCQTIEDVRLVARFALDEEMALDSLRNCTINDVPVVSIFLRALLGEARP